MCSSDLLSIYVLEPVAGRTHGLKPVMRWEARIPVIKDVPAGEAVSYGRTWTAERDTRTAIIPCGYADGMLRSASGKFEVSINGVRYPQVGRVCMDQFVVDLGPDAPVRRGGELVGGGLALARAHDDGDVAGAHHQLRDFDRTSWPNSQTAPGGP